MDFCLWSIALNFGNFFPPANDVAIDSSPQLLPPLAGVLDTSYLSDSHLLDSSGLLPLNSSGFVEGSKNFYNAEGDLAPHTGPRSAVPATNEPSNWGADMTLSPFTSALQPPFSYRVDLPAPGPREKSEKVKLLADLKEATHRLEIEIAMMWLVSQGLHRCFSDNCFRLF